MKMTRSATSRAKPISWVTTIIVMPERASSSITSSTSLIISGSSAEVGSSKSITRGSIASARAMATRCCWPPDSCPGNFSACSGMPTRSRSAAASSSASGRDFLRTPDRRERDVVNDGQVREQVELLEHHADLGADLLDVAQVVGELDAVDDDLPVLVGLQTG